MRNSQIFTIQGAGTWVAGAILPLVILFTLGSCCTSYSSTKPNSKKPCNCSQNDFAVNSTNSEQMGVILDKGNHKISEAVNSVEMQGISSKKEDQQILKALQPTEPSSNISALYLAEKKKGPLGVKAITTQLLAGANISSASKKESGLRKKSGVGFQAGVGGNYAFSKNFSIRPALLFRQSNFSTISGEGMYESTNEYSYNSLSAPIIATVRASDKLSIGAGPEINYLLSASSQYNEGEKTKITDQSTRLGLGMEANITYKVSKRVAIQIFVNKGLTNLDKEEEYSPGGNYNSGGGTTTVHGGLRVIMSICDLMHNIGFIGF
jgi:Outer membrane protein beta-barrel domain